MTSIQSTNPALAWRAFPDMQILPNKYRNNCGLAPVQVVAVLITFATFVPCDRAKAQTPTGNSAVQQAQLFNQRPTSATSAEGERLFPPLDSLSGGESAADADLGEQWMLKPNAPVNPFTARASLSLFYTTNVALSRASTLSDGFAVADVGVGYARPITQDWAVAADLQQSFFRYDTYTEFDFESTGASVALSHQARQLGNVVFSLQYGLNRLTRGSADAQLYLGNTVALAATKVIPTTSASFVDFNGALGYTFADPGDLERAELRLAMGYSVRLARNFNATAVGRLEVYDYTNESRQDLLQSVALGVRWDITPLIAVSASLSAVNNISTQRVFRYETINTGVTLTAHIRF